MIIGDFPSLDDKKNNSIFSDESGVLLNKMLSAISLSTDNVYLTNIVHFYLEENKQEYLNQKLFVPDMAESLKVDVMLEELLLDYFKMTPGQNFESITVGNRSFVDHENKICYFKQISLENYLNKTSWKKKWFETSQLLKKFYTLKAHNGKIGNQKCRYWSLQKGTGENAKELIFESPTKVTPNKLKPAPY